jgi:hypothetical protein
MHREVIHNNPRLDKEIHIKVSLEGFLNDLLDLARLEILIEILSVALVFNKDIVTGKTAFNFQKFTHDIDNVIVEKDNNDALLVV